MEIVFRSAVLRDAPALATLICLASQGHYPTTGFEFSLGGTREHQLAELARLAAAGARTRFHFSHFEVAEVDGRVVASAAGFDQDRAEEQVPDALREIGWSEDAIQSLNQRLGEIYQEFPAEPPSCWTLDHVAVLPAHRHMGLARAVVERQFARARAAGLHLCKLEVFRDNLKAISLYQSLGFVAGAPFCEEPLRRLMGRDAMVRMQVKI